MRSCEGAIADRMYRAIGSVMAAGERVSVLVVANFLSAKGLNRGYSEELADRLEARGHRVVRTSSEIGRARRLLDMLATAWRRRRDYAVALVDVFSGPSFVWAEAVAFELRRLGKPYVLTLRGGSLPEFARRWPRRVRQLLQSAVAVTAPSGFLGRGMRAYREDLMVVPNALELDALPVRDARASSRRASSGCARCMRSTTRCSRSRCSRGSRRSIRTRGW